MNINPPQSKNSHIILSNFASNQSAWGERENVEILMVSSTIFKPFFHQLFPDYSRLSKICAGLYMRFGSMEERA